MRTENEDEDKDKEEVEDEEEDKVGDQVELHQTVQPQSCHLTILIWLKTLTFLFLLHQLVLNFKMNALHIFCLQKTKLESERSYYLGSQNDMIFQKILLSLL